MIGYPLDSKVEYDTEGKPIYDRAITSEPLRRLYDKLFSTGVMPNPSDNFQVMAGDAGMTVKVNPGFAVVKGCLKLEETIRTIEIQAASSSLDRIDTVVLRLNDEVNARICDLYVRQGIPASSPTRPDLVRSGSVYEIGLADIFIPKNTATIVQKRITDTRLDPDRCGYVSSISKFDTETLYLQIQNDLADFKSNEQAEFLEWFEYIKGQLSEDVAGNLQNQIGVLETLKTEIKTNIVNAINWLKEKLDELVLKIGTEDISKIGDGSVTGAISTLNSNFSDIGRTYLLMHGGYSDGSNVDILNLSIYKTLTFIAIWDNSQFINCITIPLTAYNSFYGGLLRLSIPNSNEYIEIRPVSDNQIYLKCSTTYLKLRVFGSK